MQLFKFAVLRNFL